MIYRISGKLVAAGCAAGVALASAEPLSFWGGYDQKTGEIIDRRHPLSGETAAGRILVVPFTRGSSTTTAILLESVRAGVAPAAIVTDRADRFLALASIVADEMYDAPIPIVTIDREEFDRLRTGDRVTLTSDGTLTVTRET
jgi:predicted aconitase with swiveling domain